MDDFLACSAFAVSNSYETCAQDASEIAIGDERNIINAILASRKRQNFWESDHLHRRTFSTALDILAEPPSGDTVALTISSLDREFRIITNEIAPYVRIIAAYDQHLESQRLKLSSLLSEGGRPNKRLRTTRAARSALEGGQRQSTRRERWFEKDVNLSLVLQTGGEEWSGLGSRTWTECDGNSSIASTPFNGEATEQRSDGCDDDDDDLRD